MPASEDLTRALATLSDRELRILRMLAAGHTIKSIAQSSGHSEASVNERLRDARRKTGIGSSRELARLVYAQKNWDKNPDLLTDRSTTDDGAKPEGRRSITSKGKKIMFAAIPIAAMSSLFFFSATAPQMSQAPADVSAKMAQPMALIGKWSVDVAQIPQNERPRQVTISFDRSSDSTWTTTVEIIQADGTIVRGVSTAELNGEAATITGNMGFIDSVSLRQPSQDTLVMTLTKNGKAVSTRVYTVSKDRNAMTETIIWADNNVKKMVTNHFMRVG